MQKPLTQSDRNKLRKKVSFMGILVIVIITIFTFIYFYVLKKNSTNDDFGYIPLVMFGVFGLFFAGIIGYMVWVFGYDLKNGVKNCFEGIIEDKRLNIKHSSSMRSGAGKSGRKTSTKRDYYIIVNGTKHNIEHQMYTNVNVGDHIYFEVAPKSNVILSYTVLEKIISASAKQITSYNQGKYPDSKIRKTALSEEDKNNLRVLYKSETKARLQKIMIIGLPIAGLLIYGLGGLLVFLFPLPIIFIYQLYKLVKSHFNYKKSVNERKKNLIETQVTDKSFTTISNNGRKRYKYTLKTTYKSIIVPEMVYQKVEAGDEIIIHQTLPMAQIIGISVADVYYAM